MDSLIRERNSFRQLCWKGNLEEVRAALVRGEDVNGVEARFSNQTGLMLAVMKGHNSIVRLLLEQPTLDLNLSDNGGTTALHFAAQYDNAEVVRLLLFDPRQNCVNPKDNYGKTPVMSAMFYRQENALRELVSNPSVDLSTLDGRGRSLEEVARWALNNFLIS